MARVPDSRPILVAPDSFKGTLSAAQVTTAIATGLDRAGWVVDRCPVADGGEGTLRVLLEALGGERIAADAHDPLGRPRTAGFALLDDGRAVVETAAASGLGLVAESERDAEQASTQGTGELIAAAIAAGAREVLVGAGGSATTDGGAGALDAIAKAGGLGAARLTVLCDVRTPFEQAARVFAPQKGADANTVRRLTRRLARQARALPVDPRGVAMTGCAGGLSGGLWAALGARLVPGGAFVLDSLGFDPRARAARAVLTGEGRLDRQSLVGKLVGEVATRCRQGGIPCHVIVGQCRIDGFEQRILDLASVDEAGDTDAIARAARLLGERLHAESER
jgi:glycerate kinase